jgi:unsaturated rhamnogalacturonyl hydrolase
MSRLGDSLEFREGAKAAWSYPSGFLAYALMELGDAGAGKAYGDYGERIVDSFIRPDGAIRGYASRDSNLDMIAPGRALLAQYEKIRAPNLAKAAGILRRQLSEQPRTSEGAFWHKRIYPNQVWLDGFYMAGPFYAHYGAVFGDPKAAEDEARQILVADRHLYDPVSGLYYHAWD